jgi:hypothetical protein
VDGELNLVGASVELRVTPQVRLVLGDLDVRWSEPEVVVPAGESVAVDWSWPLDEVEPSQWGWPGSVSVVLSISNSRGSQVGAWVLPSEPVVVDGDLVRVGGRVEDLSPVVVVLAEDEVLDSVAAGGAR